MTVDEDRLARINAAVDGNAHEERLAACGIKVANGPGDVPHPADGARHADHADDALVRELTELADRVRRGEAVIRDVDPLHYAIGELQRLRDARRPRGWRRAVEVVDEIAERASEPWIPLTLGGDEIMSLTLGESAYLIGAAKRGKTSLAVSIAIEHAQHRGPAIVCSLELAARTLVARGIGSRCDAGWREVLTGAIPLEHMRAAMPERLVVIDRDVATLAVLERAIAEVRAEHPGEPILVVVDYVQIVESERRDTRDRVADAVERVSRLVGRTGVVGVVLSQSSRAASRQLASGERIGAEAADAGAETAAIERWAAAVITIGTIGEPAEDGTRPAELSLAVARYEAGDRVVPARVDLRTGRWRIAGEARPAAQVRAERESERTSARQRAAELAIVAAAERATEPQSRAELERAPACQLAIARAAIAALLGRGELVEVRHRRPRQRAWTIWTPTRASEAGIPTVGSAVAS